jgi:hypothetical protein
VKIKLVELVKAIDSHQWRTRPKATPHKPRLRDMAWLAGLYEGEGSCSIVRRYSNRPAARFHLGSTDRDVVDRVRRITSMGTISTSVRKKKNATIIFKRKPKPFHLWEVSRKAHVRLLIGWLLPFMCKRRRERLKEAQAVMTTPVPCKFGGHILTSKNTGRWPNGSMKCLDCAAASHARKIKLQRRRRREQRQRIA